MKRIRELRFGRAEIIAAVGLIVYTFGRFLAAGGTMTTYGVDARWFLFWDAAPIPAYVWAIGRLVRGLTDDTTRFSQLLVAAAVAIVAFMCPYFYLFYAGAKEFPLSAWVLLVVIIGLLAANAVWDIRKKVRVAKTAATPTSISGDGEAPPAPAAQPASARNYPS